MTEYCNGCENHCAANDLHCERGYMNLGEGAACGGRPRRGIGGRFETLPMRPDEGMGGRFETLPMRPGEGMEGRFETLPMRPGAMPGHPHDRGGGHGMEHGGEEFGSGRMPRDMGPRGGDRGMPPHGRGPGMPPHFGMPSGEMLRERIDEAELPELLGMAARLMPRRPGRGSARGQALILSILAGREALSQRELQQMLGVQPGSMSEIVSKLERKGYLTRERGEDRRGNTLRITDAGRSALPEAGDGADDGLFDALTAEERESLAKLLRTLLTDWAGRQEQPGPDRPEPRDAFMPPERTEKV